MPLYLYSTRSAPKNDFVPFHIYVQQVLCDAESTRATDPSWIAYAFNVLLAEIMDRGPSLSAVKRGMQSLLHDYPKHPISQYADTVLPSLLHDQKSAQARVNELCASIADFGLPTYFGTLTCNQPLFPGVREIHELLRKSKKDKVDAMPYMVLFLRTWHRCCNIFVEWLCNGTDAPLGHIRHAWARHEFQIDVGNFPHLHFFAWTDENVGDPSAKQFNADCQAAINRVTATIFGAFDGCKDPKVLEALANELQTHKCGVKCFRGENKCRFGAPWELHDSDVYELLEVEVPQEMQQLLEKCGLGYYDEKKAFHMHPFLTGGKHLPRRGITCDRVSPLLASHFFRCEKPYEPASV